MNNPDQSESAVVIRDISTMDELKSVEALQKEVWGGGDLDVVPLTQLVAIRETGGVLVGAFDGDKMAGFVFGFVGYEEQRRSIPLKPSIEIAPGPFSLNNRTDVQPVIHSHMLAVKREYRNLDLGYRLKLAQRDRALAAGFSVMTWTFDPLQCINAHLNFQKLGVVSDAYKIDFYGAETSSFLHQDGTDRLWVTWLLSSPRVKAKLDEGKIERRDPADRASLISVGEGNTPVKSAFPSDRPPSLAIEIPGNITEIREREPELSSAWREATREAFTKALALGYIVSDFHRLNRGEGWLGFYVLTPSELFVAKVS